MDDKMFDVRLAIAKSVQDLAGNVLNNQDDKELLAENFSVLKEFFSTWCPVCDKKIYQIDHQSSDL